MACPLNYLHAMASIVPDYEYDIFISYRHNDNLDGWVSDFVKNLEKELKSTIKEPVSIYFDTNPQNGLLETHNVDKSLEGKLKCLIFIPIISQTYCDVKSFAWQHEFCSFNQLARKDQFGLDIKLSNGNVAGRILPVKIHDLDRQDAMLLQDELGGVLRAIEFIYKEPGVNRPLKPSDNKNDNHSRTDYRNQINKVANAIHEIIRGIKESENLSTGDSNESAISQSIKLPFSKKLTGRNVLRASLAYILTAMVFWKVLIISSGLLHLTDNIIQLITLILIVLFPIAMLMAWLYERSPKGFIRTGSVASLENPYPDTKKKPFTSYTFISLLLVTIAALFLLFPQTNKAHSSDNFKNAEKSIAVLPFKNDSNDSSNVYIVNGLMESILNNLAKIKDLNVISRTSVEKYRNNPEQTREIAKELNVNYIIEGSGQKYGDEIFLTVQLVEASTDKHIWSNQYKRNASDIINLQIEVAKTIAGEIEAVITPEEEERIKKAPTENLAAYNIFIKGSELYNRPEDVDSIRNKNLEQAKIYFEQAVELDKEFAQAYAYLAYIYYTLYWANSEYLTQMEYYADKAMLYDPSLDMSLIAKGTYFTLTGDNETATPYFEKALQYNPNSYIAFRSLANIYRQKPDTEKFMEYALKGIRLYTETGDTINSNDFSTLGDALRQTGFFEDAEIYFTKALNSNPENSQAAISLASLYNDKLEHKHAKDMLLSLFSKDSSNIDVIRTLGLTSYYMRDYKEAYHYYNKMIEYNSRNPQKYKGDYGRIGFIFSRLGNETEAEKYFRMNLDYVEPQQNINTYRHLSAYYSYKGNSSNALEQMRICTQQNNYQYWVIMNFKSDPMYDNIRELPEFKKIFAEMETNFWKNHDRIKASLEEKGLL